MGSHESPASRRVLVIDDNEAIHEDFRKVLAGGPVAADALAAAELALLGESAPTQSSIGFEIDSALQGQAGVAQAKLAREEGRPYELAFVDMRMPPGWDGLETVQHLWAVDPDIQVVICSAHTDYDWNDVVARLNHSDKLLVVKKPFEPIEVVQCAHALTRKWQNERILRQQVETLEQAVIARTEGLEAANKQLVHEMQERERLGVELQLAQKLESVGRLAAGMAHEINTPIQYVGDSVHFLRSSFDDVLRVLAAYRETANAPPDLESINGRLAAARTTETAADFEFLTAEIPKAFDRVMDGVERVSGLVRAMKEFSHPDATEHHPVDLNRAIDTTLTVARSEYKYCATIERHFEPLPEVPCNVGELGQVFLNLIVNAAQALQEAGNTVATGRITVRTAVIGSAVQITIADNGPGIPAEHLEKIYDPFFTTKEVGKGTGQGLAIARSIVVDKHGGELGVRSALGAGAEFTISLPLQGRKRGGAT